MKRLFSVTIIWLLLLTPVFTTAADFTGTIQGFSCVTQGKTCPIGKEDYLATLENIFVLLVDAAKREYYFLPNVEREVLVRYINVQIKVSGELDNKFKSIKVKDIYMMNGKMVWSSNRWDKLYQWLFME
jgi:hypothetical protein